MLSFLAGLKINNITNYNFKKCNIQKVRDPESVTSVSHMQNNGHAASFIYIVGGASYVQLGTNLNWYVITCIQRGKIHGNYDCQLKKFNYTNKNKTFLASYTHTCSTFRSLLINPDKKSHRLYPLFIPLGKVSPIRLFILAYARVYR